MSVSQDVLVARFMTTGGKHVPTGDYESRGGEYVITRDETTPQNGWVVYPKMFDGEKFADGQYVNYAFRGQNLNEVRAWLLNGDNQEGTA